MVLPFDRDAMKERNRRDEADAAEQARRRQPGEGLRQALELSDHVRLRASACDAAWILCPPDDLADKAQRYPVRVLT